MPKSPTARQGQFPPGTRAALRSALLAFADDSPDGVLIASSAGRIAYANAPAAALLGASPDALRGQRLREAIAAVPSLLRAQARRGATPGRTAAARRAAARPDSAGATLRVREIPRLTRNLRAYVLRDRGVERPLGEELKKKTRLLVAAEHIGRMGAWELDMRTMLISWTPEMRRIMEVPLATQTQSIEESYQFYSEPSRAIVREAFDSTLATGAPYDLELEGVTGRGRRIWVREICRATVRGGRITSVVGISQDITERRLMAEYLASAANRERARIGADLHDGLGQELTGLALLLSAAAKRAADQSRGLAQELRELSSLARRAVDSARAISHGLLPIDLRNDGLEGALRRLAATTGTALGVAVSVRVRGDRDFLPSGAFAENLYRIAQEAISNAVRHGKARRVSIVVEALPTQTVLSISNDGLPIPRPRAERGMGLQIMQHRARTMGGLIEVRQVAPTGARIRCIVPRRGAA